MEYDIKEIYLIALLDGFLLEGTSGNEYLYDILLYNRYLREIFHDGLGYIYIELIKFVKNEAELKTDLDRWLYVLKNMSRMKKISTYLRKPIFEKLFNIAEYSNLTKEEKIMYDSSLKRKWDNENALDYAVKEAKREGIKEGRYEEAIQIARELKKEGMPIAQIARFTKLSEEEIEDL